MAKVVDNIRSVLWLGAAVACLGITAPMSRGALVYDDFSYPDTTVMNTHPAGGSGWSGTGGWGSTAATDTSTLTVVGTSNLSYSTGGYSYAQTGTGLVRGPNNGSTPAFRGINRALASPMTNGSTVWFTLLCQVSTNGSAGIQFNNPESTGLDYNQGLFSIMLTGTNVNAYYNSSSVSSNVASGLTVGQTHLILGEWVIGDPGSNDTLNVWADPANLSSLGAPVSFNSAQLGSSGITTVGIEAFGVTTVGGNDAGEVDALRISNDANAFAEVTTPEPGTLALLGLGGMGLLCRRRSSPQASARR